jgi:hypothetical protein
MPKLDDKIEGFVCGDDFQVKRTVTLVPDGQTITKAVMTVKKRYDLDTTDTQAVVQKVITSTLGPNGQITDPGTGTYPNRSATVLFSFDGPDTQTWRGYTMYHWDIEVYLSGGTSQTPLGGHMTGLPGVTNKAFP